MHMKHEPHPIRTRNILTHSPLECDLKFIYKNEKFSEHWARKYDKFIVWIRILHDARSVVWC